MAKHTFFQALNLSHLCICEEADSAPAWSDVDRFKGVTLSPHTHAQWCLSAEAGHRSLNFLIYMSNDNNLISWPRRTSVQVQYLELLNPVCSSFGFYQNQTNHMPFEMYFFFLGFIFAVLGLKKPKSSCMLGKSSTTELLLQPWNVFLMTYTFIYDHFPIHDQKGVRN
jgi:hypothetical protein